MQNILNLPQAQGEAVGAAIFRFVRATAIALAVVVPLGVIPWGEHAYSYIKSLLTITLTLAGVLGWTLAYLIAKRPKWHATPPELALWASLVPVLASSAVSVDPRTSFLGALGRYEGLLTVCAYVALYFVGVHFFGSRRGVQSLAVSVTVAAAVAIGYGAVQVFVPPQFAGEAIVTEWYGGVGIPRIGSTLGGPIVFGGYLAFTLPIICALAALSQNRIRFVWLAVALVAVIDTALTLTRAAWVASLIGMGIFIAATGPKTGVKRSVVAGGLTAAILVSALILTTVVATPSQIRSRITTSIDTGAGSLAQHVYIWEHVWRLIRERPLLGWGLDTLGSVFPYDRESLVRVFGRRPVTVDRAHNDLLQIAVSIGIPGALAYASFWALMVAAGVRLWRRQAGCPRLLAAAVAGGLAAYLVQAQFSFSTVAFTPVVWLIAGAVCGWESSARNTWDMPQPDPDDPAP